MRTINSRYAIVSSSNVLVLCSVLLFGAGCGSPGGESGDPFDQCNAANCAGCCLNNACQVGTTNFACGRGGTTCMTCGGSAVCLASQSCGVNPDQQWQVALESATIASNDNGTAWDGDNSTPDVRVSIDCPPSGTQWDRQSAESSSYSPTWNTAWCKATARQLLGDRVQFRLDDVDAFSDDSITPNLTFQLTEQDLLGGFVSLSASGGMTSATFSLIPLD